ncbi:MAG: hypothetical protein BMS9Abin14_350 [Gammaproteobacteria bacterium]|nr:MAG: hypothetical protein BMS9Abin14_350 [Gammaproteobacteria bacterium]
MHTYREYIEGLPQAEKADATGRLQYQRLTETGYRLRR